MLRVSMETALRERNIPFGLVEVRYPSPEAWDIFGFRELVNQELSGLRGRFSADGYDRKSDFGDNPYVRFFKKFKKTYPVMLQFESVILRGQPFPQDNPIREVPFLMELTTRMLSGVHDVDQVRGAIELFLGVDRTPFMGLNGRESYTYPGDFCGRDDGGVIFSAIAGCDMRTRARLESRHAFYPVFGTPDMPAEAVWEAIGTLVRYVNTLAPESQTRSFVL